jgi:adenylate kinase family enzyme
MKRVVVLGVAGSGKTTLAQSLARRFGSRYVDMNALLEGESSDVRARVDEATSSPNWVADASLERWVGDLVLERADGIVWLDVPLRVALARSWRRSRREGEPPFALLWGAVRAHFSNRRRFPQRVARFQRVVRLRSPGEVETWLRR